MIDIDHLNFDKLGGLIPAIIQEEGTMQVLMLGFMNREALERTIADGLITFWSRTRNRLWQKGETSGNRLTLVSMSIDCDNDTILVTARTNGPTCHNGTHTCFAHDRGIDIGALGQLERTIASRRAQMPEDSYTTRLFRKGRRSIAQKVGEEGVEVALASIAETPERVAEESADLLYHLVVLLADCGLGLDDVMKVLRGRFAK